jgi:hypothetical protein
VHIDTGVLGVSQGGLLSAVQGLMIEPIWMALVWVVHAMVVMLEWGFTVDLLGTSSARGLGNGLARMREAFTAPLLPLALAVASVLAAYHGIVRRRGSRALGDTVVMAAMMAGGLWVIGNPSGTVGFLAAWTNEASLGALTAGASGTPSTTSGGMGQQMRGLFAMTVEAPWCYMEFGDVAWCRDASRLDPDARAAGLRIASGELLLATCGHRTEGLPTCSPLHGTEQSALTRGAELLRRARTNADLFLSLPPNSPARNGISEDPSLLRAICRGAEATTCQGNAAAQAEFRTNSGTWARVGGLLLITGGLAGVLLLFGFVGVRLLTAATLSLLLLLLAPAAVLAPAFGERGREVFRLWASRLLGAVLAKVLFAFLLGVLLAVLGVISSLPAIGWWAQWLLMSSFAWTAFARRHHVLAVPGAFGPTRRASRGSATGSERVRVAAIPRALLRTVRLDVGDQAEPSASLQARLGVASLMAGGVPARRRSATGPSPDRSRVDHEAVLEGLSTRSTAKRVQLERLQRAETLAFVASDGRRRAELAHRGSRVQGEIERADEALVAARYLAENGRPLAPMAREPGTPDSSQPTFAQITATRKGFTNPEAGQLGVHSADWPSLPGGRQPSRSGRAGDSGTSTEDKITRESKVPWWLAPEQESAIMRDAREVEAGRKRRLGFDQE